MTLEDIVLIFLRDLKTKQQKLNQKQVESMHYIKVYTEGVLKIGFFLVETSDTKNVNISFSLSRFGGQWCQMPFVIQSKSFQ